MSDAIGYLFQRHHIGNNVKHEIDGRTFRGRVVDIKADDAGRPVWVVEQIVGRSYSNPGKRVTRELLAVQCSRD